MKKCFLFVFFTIIPLLKIPGQYKLENAFPKLDFLQPLDFQVPPDGSNRAVVVTQQGIIYIFTKDTGTVEKKVFLDIRSKVTSGGEMGLLGLVFHPDFKKNKYFYVNYTASSPLRTVIARYTVSETNPDSADTASEEVILTFNQPYVNHKAGQLAFGPDGYLYIGTGDGGSGGDPEKHGQDRTSMLGKMLRIDVNHKQGNKQYSIPRDNPFADNKFGYRKEIFACGFRNPWRYSFDPVTKKLWVGDVGENSWEEIDIVEKGKNYGWNIMEGFHCFNPAVSCDKTGLTMPVFEYGHGESSGNCLIGGAVYRGSEFPDLQGKYIYGDFGSGRIWALDYNNPASVKNELLINSAKNISSFGTDSNNELYICAYDGRIYRLAKSTSTILADDKPKDYNLSYNYPNSSNAAVSIIADIKQAGNISIEIFNSLGEKIADVYKGNVQPGRYEYSWDGSAFPEGVYIYKLTAGDFSVTKKMALIR